MGNTGKNRRKSSARGWEQRAVTGITQEIHAIDPLTERKYLRDFYGAFRVHEDAVIPPEFEDALAEADVVLLGDYHTLPASQRYAARLMEQMAQNKRTVALGIEAVLACDQCHLDAWQRGKMSEQQLRLALRFDEEWGYEWTPIYALLLAARRNESPAYGLDCGPRSNLRAIRRRDRHAAAKIAEIRERHVGCPVLVLFGESHLAPGHLPAAIRRLRPEDKIVTVVQNCDALYWQLALDSCDEKPVLRICEDVFCVFTATLFEKYDSYRSYLNGDENSCQLPVPSCQSGRKHVRPHTS